MSSGIEVSTVIDGGALLIALGAFTSDSRVESPPAEVSISFTATHDDSDASAKLDLAPATITFDFVLTVGIGDEAGPLVGGVSGSMVCRGEKALAEITVTQQTG